MIIKTIKMPTNLGGEFKAHVTKTVEKLKRYFGDRPISLNFTEISPANKLVRIEVKGFNRSYFAQGEGANYYSALNMARKNIRKNLSRKKVKRRLK